MSSHRRGIIALFIVGTLLASSIVLFSIRPAAGITFGSGAVILAVLAHFGVLAAVVVPFVARRRRGRL